MLRHKIPSTWKATTLDLHAEVRTGVAKGKKGLMNPISFPYLRVANVQDGHLDLSEVKTIDIEKRDADRYRLEEGDVLLTEGGDYDKLGRGAVWRGQIPHCLHQNHVFSVRPNRHDLLSEFLAYQAGSAYGKQYFQSCSKQSTNLASINSTQLRQFPLLLPTLAEQHAIIRVLGIWDAAIDGVDALIAAKQRYIRGMLADCVNDARNAIDNDAWLRTTISEVATLVQQRVTWDEDATYRLISVRRACGGLVFRGDRKGHEILTKDMYAVRAGDFLISKRQVVHGAWAMVLPEFDGAHVSKEYACLRAKPGKLWMPYFDWLSRTERLQHEAFICSYGIDIEKMVLNLDWLLQTPLLLPNSIDIQKRMAAALDCLQSEFRLLQMQAKALRKQKNGLMQKLLTGEWRVPVRDGEIDAMGERLAAEVAQ